MSDYELQLAVMYRTATMIKALELRKPNDTFLRDTFFPHDPVRDQSRSERVIVEYKDGKRLVAPCVMPRSGGVVIEREASYVREYTPPLIAPKRVISADDIEKATFNDLMYGLMDPDAKERAMLAEDLEMFSEMFDAREEQMAAQVLINNSCVLTRYSGEFVPDKAADWEIRFYDEDANPARYMPAVPWTQADAQPMQDLKAMMTSLTKRGLPATMAVMSSDVAEMLLNNQDIRTLLDIQRISIGSIAPMELPNGAAHFGTININGRELKLVTYDGTYDDVTGIDENGRLALENKPFLPAGTIIVSSPNVGRRMYASITQMDKGGKRTVYTNARVPKVTVDEKTEVRELTIKSRPLLMPKYKSPWITASVI